MGGPPRGKKKEEDIGERSYEGCEVRKETVLLYCSGEERDEL